MSQPIPRSPLDSAPIRSVAVFTGSSAGIDPEFARAASEAGRFFASRGLSVVYGGGHVGLMGVVADAALAAGGEVIGVIPETLVSGEIAHTGLTRLDVVADMHERKQRMAELAGAFVALPGGAGTLEEFFEVWTWQQLGIHDKPVGLLNTLGYWNPMLEAIDHMVAQGFLKPAYRAALIVEDSPQKLLERLESWVPSRPKWTRPQI